MNDNKSNPLIKVDIKTFLRLQKFVANVLAEILITGDQEAFQEMINSYLNLVNEEELSRITKLPIDTIRMVAVDNNYSIETLFKITSAINKAAA